MHIGEILSATSFPRPEAEILLASLLGKERTWVIAHPEANLSQPQAEKWNVWEQRRTSGEPVSYIIERTSFYGRPFTVRRGALVPRPATEGIVAVAAGWLEQPSDTVVPVDAGIVAVARVLREGMKPSLVVDIGTGSGCIAVTLALEHPALRIIATDISEDALAVARDNAAMHRVADRIGFRRGSMLEPVASVAEPFLLVANPPYVPDGRELSKDITDFEPSIAVFAGPEGLDILLPLAKQAKEHPFCAGFVFECEEEQVRAVDSLLGR